MLVIDGIEDYLAEVRAYADKIGMREQLEKELTRLDTYAEHGERGKTRCLLGKDWAPYSFAGVMQIHKRTPEGSLAQHDYEHFFTFGLIFHGSHDNGGDGSAPTFAVNLTPVNGWALHT